MGFGLQGTGQAPARRASRRSAASQVTDWHPVTRPGQGEKYRVLTARVRRRQTFGVTGAGLLEVAILM
jgi:hypothetical protein